MNIHIKPQFNLLTGFWWECFLNFNTILALAAIVQSAPKTLKLFKVLANEHSCQGWINMCQLMLEKKIEMSKVYRWRQTQFDDNSSLYSSELKMVY